MGKKTMGAQAPDEETQKILKDMEDEGEVMPKNTPADEPIVTPPEKDTTTAPKAKPAPESVPIVDMKDEDEEDKDGGDEPLPDLTRPVQAVPYYKFKKEREKRIELEKALAMAKEQPSSSEQPAEMSSDDINKLAETYGLDPQFVTDLTGVLTKNIKPNALDEETKADLAMVKQSRIVAEEEAGFTNELNTLAKDYPEVLSQRDSLHQLAYLDGYNKKSLFEIYFRYLKPKIDPRHTMEPSKGINGEGGINMEDIANNPDALNNMSDEDFAKYSEQMGKNGKRMLISSH